MNSLFFGIIAIAFAAVAVVIIHFLIETKKTIAAIKESILAIEEAVKPSLVELPKTLASIRTVADNAGDITDDIKVLSGSVREFGENITNISRSVDRITANTAGQISGLKAGINAALSVISKHYFSRFSKK